MNRINQFTELNLSDGSIKELKEIVAGDVEDLIYHSHPVSVLLKGWERGVVSQVHLMELSRDYDDWSVVERLLMCYGVVWV